MEGNNHYNYYALQFIPDNKDIYGSSGKWNGRNTWKDWHLIPSSRPVINPPTIKSNYIDIPGGNGTIDASSILTEYPVYNDREGQIEYYVIRDGYDNYESSADLKNTRDYSIQKYSNWNDVYSTVMNYLGGKKFKVILEEDPGYFYRGRVNVNQWKSEKDWSKITLDYHLEPFKYEVASSTDRWKWNPFSFVDGIITPESNGSSIYYNLTLNSSNRESIVVENYNSGNAIYGVKVPIIPGTMPFSPEFSLQCLTPITSGQNIWMNILQIRKYSGDRKIFLGHDNHTKFYSDTGIVTKRIYDMTFYEKDYEEFIFFEIPPNYTYRVTVKFRRGWL